MVDEKDDDQKLPTREEIEASMKLQGYEDPGDFFDEMLAQVAAAIKNKGKPITREQIDADKATKH